MTLRYTRHPDLRLTVIGDEGVALHLGTRRYYSVSASGVEILETLRAPGTMADIVARLTGTFDVSAETAERSAQDFLEAGRRHGLVIVETIS